MTWNVRSLRDDRAAVVRVLRRCAPDVRFVQEAPRFLRAQSKLAALARESGLVVAAGGRPAAGVALLTTLRMDVTASEDHLLAKSSGLHQRGIALAEMKLGDFQFLATAVHLGLRSEERLRHASEINKIINRRALPAVIAGDFNERSDGGAWQALMDTRRDVGASSDLATFSAADPRRRIDTILVPNDWTAAFVSPLEIVDESDLIAATDHRPVIADVMG
jgi:endonuclease/exonuclease/phosphatase family metal-dependent hydrolase